MTSQEVVEQSGSTDVSAYERGLSVRSIVKGALARFLPGSVISLIGGAAFFGVSVSGEVLAAVGGLLGVAGVLTIGFGACLLGMKRWLYPDARVDGGRSFVAGLMSPLALFIAATTGRGWTMTELPLLLVLIGVIMALGMFFAWLTPTPEHMRPTDTEVDTTRPLDRLPGRAS